MLPISVSWITKLRIVVDSPGGKRSNDSANRLG
jgi:hypothetical protein